MSNLVEINGNISYLPATIKPFSCDVVFIKTNKATWIFDVGMSGAAAEAINAVEGPKKVVLSHFHPDHILNLIKVSYDELYVGANTKKYTLKGTVVSGSMQFDEEPEIKLYEIPSSHAKGCLCLGVGDYLFTGDGTYCKEKILAHSYNTQLLKAEIDFLESVDYKYVCLSHDKHFVQDRLALINLHKEIYARRKPNQNTISVEDFFNPDGTVKQPEE